MQNKIIKYTKKTLLWTLTPVLTLVVFVALFINIHPTFGHGQNAESLTKISHSKHYHDGHFHNLVKTDLMTESDEESYSIMDYFFPPEDKNPGKPLPSQKLENANIKNGTYTWLGHFCYACQHFSQLQFDTTHFPLKGSETAQNAAL